MVTIWAKLIPYLPSIKFRKVDISRTNTTFGREPGCTHVFDRNLDQLAETQYLDISRTHFEIIYHESTAYIKDYSLNGTFLNDIRIGKGEQVKIFDEDVISINHPENRIYIFCKNFLS